ISILLFIAFENLKKANTLGVSFLLKLEQKSQHLSVNFFCPSLVFRAFLTFLAKVNYNFY
ncbi:hypothetical protein, partial [Mesomycoplasma ovipneumoniae]|uniref:hypothetical protein n=1 Tax=Mesomycoplasma ovipneumoniae TaxID=29562 RepID=UPI0020CEC2A4